MALNFPPSPVNGQTYSAPNGVTYQWLASKGVWTGGPTGGGSTFGTIDDISSQFNGSTTAFTLTTNGSPLPTNLTNPQLLITIGGILQAWESAYDFNALTGIITFTGAPPTGVSFSGLYGGGSGGNGTINNIVAGTGLSGGGSFGTVTLNNTGVTQIVPGSNITISPPTGTGIVTINSTGGGGGGGGLTGLQEIDDISSLFNGTTVTFTLQIAGSNLPAGTSTSQLLLFIGGSVQNPGTAFTFDSVTSQVTFTGAPLAGRQFIGFVGGSADPITSVVAGAGLTGGGTTGAVTLSVGAGTGITVGTGTVSLSDTGVAPGSYTNASITVDAQGRLTVASSGAAASSFPSGTLLSFPQTNAPTGWTQVTNAVYNDASIRLVTAAGGGAGGSIGFSTLFSSSATYSGSINITSGSVGATSLTEAQLASHAHTENASNNTNLRVPTTGINLNANGGTFGTTTGATGGNATHTHTLAGVAANGNFTSDFAVKYVNFIVASKD